MVTNNFVFGKAKEKVDIKAYFTKGNYLRMV